MTLTLVVVAMVSSLVAAAEAPTPPATAAEALASGFERLVLRVEITDATDLKAITSWLEPWEIDFARGRMIVDVDGNGYRKLLEQGFTVELLPKQTLKINRTLSRLPGQERGIPSYPCYRTVEETLATGADLAAAYPGLASWIDIGDSWEKTAAGGSPGYDLMVLRLTNQSIAGPKPVLWVEGSIHARELVTAETVTRFAEHLLANYDSDPDVTWILDHHEVHLLLVTNPDGRKHAENGLWWRKNTNENYCSPTSEYRGADLNRNFDFEWGNWGGSSGYGCDETYRGPSPASEPETQAVQNYVASVIPDQREDDLWTPAEDDTVGLFIDVHSYGQDVFTPFGFQSPPPPNDSQILTLGRKFAYFTGYDAQLGSGYPVDGSTKDWAYGRLGVPAFTFELGTEFFQDCAPFESTIYPDNLQTLLYAAKAVRRPYTQPSGPDAASVTVVPTAAEPGAVVQVAAVADDTRYEPGSGEPTQNIAVAEVYLDIPPWQNGATPIAMTAVDGSYDSSIEGVDALVDTTGLSMGRHMVFVRAQDTTGTWGPVSAAFLWLLDPSSSGRIVGVVTNQDDGSPVEADLDAGGFTASTDPIDGSYELLLPPGTYDVRVRADGFATEIVEGVETGAGDITTLDIELVPFRQILFDDVESGNLGWTAQAPWAITDAESHSPIHSWTDSPGGNYGDNRNVSLTSMELDLTEVTGVELEFSHRYEIESGWDYGHVEISVNGGASWQTITSFTGFQSGWETATIPLPELDGVTSARLRFRLETDVSWTEDGWYVDDILLRAAGPLPSPDIFASGFDSGNTDDWSATGP